MRQQRSRKRKKLLRDRKPPQQFKLEEGETATIVDEWINQFGQNYTKGGNNMIHTVFPKDADEMPQDFPTWEEAKEYAEENFSECGYVIESTEGECV